MFEVMLAFGGLAALLEGKDAWRNRRARRKQALFELLKWLDGRGEDGWAVLDDNFAALVHSKLCPLDRQWSFARKVAANGWLKVVYFFERKPWRDKSELVGKAFFITDAGRAEFTRLQAERLPRAHLISG